MEDPDQDTWCLVRFFEKLFADPRYAFLNPEGRVPGKGSRGRGSLQLSFVERPKNPRAGCLAPSANKVVVNTEHPLLVKYYRNAPAWNHRIAIILTSVLIKNAAAKKPMDAAEALALRNDLLILSMYQTW